MGKKSKSKENLTGGDDPNAAWEKNLSESVLSEQAETFSYNPATFFLKTDQATTPLHQAITNSETCSRRTFNIISYENLMDEVMKYGDPKKRPKEIPEYGPYGFNICELVYNEMIAVQKFNDKLPDDENKERDTIEINLPAQAIAYLIKFSALLIKEQRLKKLAPRETSSAEGGKGGKGKPKSPKGGAKGKGKDAGKDEVPETKKDWSTLKKRGEDEDNGRYLDDEPKHERAPTHYNLIIDIPEKIFSQVIFHCSLGLNMNVAGVLLDDKNTYDTTLHGQWDVNKANIPNSIVFKNSCNFDEISQTCFEVVKNGCFDFENFKKGLRMVAVPKLDALPAEPTAAGVSNHGNDVSKVLASIIDNVCDPTLKISRNQNYNNNCNSAKTKSENSIDALLQFESENSLDSLNANNSSGDSLLPELVGHNLENDISKIFDGETISNQNVKQKSLYHEFLRIYRNYQPYSMVSFLADDSDNSSDDEGFPGNNNNDNNQSSVSPTMLDLNMKQMVALGLPIDNIFKNKKSDVKSSVYESLNFCDSVEHLSKDSLIAYLSKLDKEYSSVTVKKFNGDGCRLIIASNSDSEFDRYVFGELDNHEYQHYVKPLIGNWLKLYESNEEAVKEQLRKLEEAQNLQKTSSLKSVTAKDASHDRFIQKDSLKGHKLQNNQNEDSANTSSSREVSAKKSSLKARSSKGSVASKQASKQTLSRPGTRDGGKHSAANSSKSEAPNSEQLVHKMSSENTVKAPEFIGTDVECGKTQNRRGESELYENRDFLLLKQKIDINEHQGSWSHDVLSEKLMSVTDSGLKLTTHKYSNPSNDTTFTNTICQLSDKTMISIEKEDLSQLKEILATKLKSESDHKLPNIETWNPKLIAVPTPKNSQDQISSNEESNIEGQLDSENNKDGEKNNAQNANLRFGQINGLTGTFVKVNNQFCTRFTWTDLKNMKDEITGQVHPSTVVKSRLVTPDGNIIDSLINNEAGESIVMTSMGGKYSINESETVNLVPDDILSYKSHDPVTNAVFTHRNDGVRIIERPDGSSITHHSDGTRITKFKDSENSSTWTCRIEHPAYGSCLFVNGSIALTLTTGIQILCSSDGQQYPVYDRNMQPGRKNNIVFTKDSWSLNEINSTEIENTFQKSNTQTHEILCIKDDGNAFRFCHSDEIMDLIENKKLGSKAYSLNGLENITTIDQIHIDQGFSPAFMDSHWHSNFAYQEENIIPEGLRISQIGGGSHAVVQKRAVLADAIEARRKKVYQIRRFTKFPLIDVDGFRKALKELESNNLPKIPVLASNDQTASLEQSELISTVLGDQNLNTTTTEPEETTNNTIDPSEAEERFDIAQRPDSSSSTVIIAGPSKKSVKRLKAYKRELSQFKIDINNLKDRDVPKYFDSDLGFSWLQTKMVLDALSAQM